MMNSETTIKLRKAALEDSRLLFKWRNHPDIYKHFFNGNPVEWDKHCKWLADKLDSQKAEIFIAMLNDKEIGVIRFEQEGGFVWVSVNVAPDKLGRGFGAKIVKMGTEEFMKHSGSQNILAGIKKENEVSVKVFKNAGYKLKEEQDDKIILEFSRYNENQIKLFEEIFPHHKWIIYWYLWRKKEVYFLRLHSKAREKAWFQELVKTGRLVQLDIKFLEKNLYDSMDTEAIHENMHKIFNSSNQSPAVKTLSNLYESNDIELAYKNDVGEAFSRFLYYIYVFEKLEELFPSQKISFIPSDGVEFKRYDGCVIRDYRMFHALAESNGYSFPTYNRVHFISWAVFIDFWRELALKGSLLVTLGCFPILIMYKCLKGVIKNKRTVQARHFKFGFNAYSISNEKDFRQSRFDFLIDQDIVRKEQSLFVSYKPFNQDTVDYLEENELNFIHRVPDYIQHHDIKHVITAYFTLLRCFFTEKRFITLASLKLIYFYLGWQGLLRQISFDHYICYCDFSILSVARNILLKKYGTKTYYYMDSSSFGCAHSKGKSKYRGLIGNIKYDYFISWSDIVSEYFQQSNAQIAHFINGGCLWAEYTRLIQEGRIPTHLKEKLYKNGYKDGVKLIAAFDTSFPIILKRFNF